MKINNKILIGSIIFITICVLGFCYNAVLAESPSASVIAGFEGEDTDADSAINTITGTIVDVIRYIGSAVALIILMVCAIKYLTASAGDRASIKKYAINYSIGAIVLFSAANLLKIIIDFVTGL